MRILKKDCNILKKYIAIFLSIKRYWILYARYTIIQKYYTNINILKTWYQKNAVWYNTVKHNQIMLRYLVTYILLKYWKYFTFFFKNCQYFFEIFIKFLRTILNSPKYLLRDFRKTQVRGILTVCFLCRLVMRVLIPA